MTSAKDCYLGEYNFDVNKNKLKSISVLNK